MTKRDDELRLMMEQNGRLLLAKAKVQKLILDRISEIEEDDRFQARPSLELAQVQLQTELDTLRTVRDWMET
ncbi:MAG: hypothetical protein V3S82_10300 [Dehalococcoidia bacterium]